MASGEKTCPECAEQVKQDARVCRFCGYRFAPALEEHGDGVAAPVGSGRSEGLPSHQRPHPLAEPETEEGPRRRWLRALGYLISVVLWSLAVAPAGQYSEGGASGILAAAVVSLAVASVLRGLYVAARHRRFMSPWLFVIAAMTGLLAVAGMRESENEATDARAVTRGVVAQSEEVTPVERCVTKVLDDVDTVPAEQRALIPGDVRSFASRFCTRAARDGVLASGGGIYPSDEFATAICVEGLLAQFDQFPTDERAFTRGDFRVFGETYCKEAISRGFLKDARSGKHRRELEALQQEVLDDLLASGRIEQIRDGP